MWGRQHENSSGANQHIEVFRLKSGTECSAGAGDIFLSYFIFAISLRADRKTYPLQDLVARVLCLFLRPAHMESVSLFLSLSLPSSPSQPPSFSLSFSSSFG